MLCFEELSWLTFSLGVFLFPLPHHVSHKPPLVCLHFSGILPYWSACVYFYLLGVFIFFFKVKPWLQFYTCLILSQKIQSTH